MPFDHILLIGFGGPEKPEDIRPFIENVTRGIPIPEERPNADALGQQNHLETGRFEARLREVERHYHAAGGRSPYNEHTLRLYNKIREKLSEKSIDLPVFIGMRNWHPLVADTLREIKQKKFCRGLGVILAPHRSDASYEKYIRTVEDGKKQTGGEEIKYEYLNSWHDHPGFIDAQAEGVNVILRPKAEESEILRSAKRPFKVAQDDRNLKNIPVIFTAHSLPLEMAEKCQYVGEVTRSSELVAKKLGIQKWQVAWQSRSGSPRQPWLEPDVVSAVRKLKSEGENSVLVVPIGFLCDHVEVLYDLDIETKEEAEKLGMKYFRASTVMDRPKFVAMFAELIQKRCLLLKKETIQ